jgi:anti-sigma B factor antagonist
VADLGDGVSAIAIRGEADLSNAPDLKEALADAIGVGTRGVLIDLTDATFIDSTTLGLMVGAVKRLRTSGGELAVACDDPNIRRIFEITLLDRTFRVLDSSDDGVAYLRGLEDGGLSSRR